MPEQVLDRPGLHAPGGRMAMAPDAPGCLSNRVDAPGSKTSRLLTVVCLVLAAVAWCRVGPDYLRMMKPVPKKSPDLYQDWASARNFRQGLPVYSSHALTMPMHLGRPQEDWEKDIQYNAHPPTSVLLALPLSGLDLPEAVLAWNLFTMAALLASLGIVAAGLPELKPIFLPVVALLPFCLPVYGNFQQGQLTFVLVALITAAWALERSGRPVAAGMLVGIAAVVKLFPAYLLVYFVARRSWRGAVAAVATMGVLTLATVAILGWSTYRDYVTVVMPTLEKFRSYAFNLSFGGFWHKLFDPSSERGWITPVWYSPAVARYGTLLSGLIATGIVVDVAYRARTREQGDLAFATAATAMLLVSPITWDYSLPLLLVPLAVLIRAAMASQRLPVLLVPMLTIFGIPQSKMMELVLSGLPPRVATPAFILGVPSLNFYALLTLFGLLAALGWGATAPEASRSQMPATGLQ